MKYVVMECHPAYSILMDETSRFVYAANLHYEVGQIIENPILMEENQKIQKSGISISVRKVIAAAACVLLMIGSGVGYYQGNLAVYSTIVVSAAADVSMQVNSHGKVLSLESINLYGEQLLKNYDGKGKDKLLVTNELIQKAIAMGYLVSGDTVYFYIDTPKSAVYSSYKSELEQEMTAYADLNAAVEQYRTNEPLPEKVQPETETVQETEIPAVTSETILETTAPEISIPEQEVIIQEEIIPQEEPIQEEIPTPENATQETTPEIPANIPVQNETIIPIPEEPSEQQPSEWNYENWKNRGNWYSYDNEYQMPKYYSHDWYDYDEEYPEKYSEKWDYWDDYDECDPSEYSEKNSWNWDMWGSWDDNSTPDTAETQEETENWNNYNWHHWKNHPDYYDYYSYSQEECPADPYEPEEEEDIDEFSEYRYFDDEELP